MKIREEQIDEFRRQSEEEFVENVASDLRENQPDKVADIDEQELRRRVRFGLEKAQKYGMTGQYPIAMFIELMFMVAPDFDEYPLVNSILKDNQIPPNDRVDRAVAEMNEQRWGNVKVRSDHIWNTGNEVN